MVQSKTLRFMWFIGILLVQNRVSKDPGEPQKCPPSCTSTARYAGLYSVGQVRTFQLIAQIRSHLYIQFVVYNENPLSIKYWKIETSINFGQSSNSIASIIPNYIGVILLD